MTKTKINLSLHNDTYTHSIQPGNKSKKRIFVSYRSCVRVVCARIGIISLLRIGM